MKVVIEVPDDKVLDILAVSMNYGDGEVIGVLEEMPFSTLDPRSKEPAALYRIVWP